jgi:hypothetical protein
MQQQVSPPRSALRPLFASSGHISFWSKSTLRSIPSGSRVPGGRSRGDRFFFFVCLQRIVADLLQAFHTSRIGTSRITP